VPALVSTWTGCCANNVNAVVTGKALFAALKDVSAADFQSGLRQVVDAIAAD
jgi:hypothetical protein